jgi:hypothetical protein
VFEQYHVPHRDIMIDPLFDVAPWSVGQEDVVCD